MNIWMLVAALASPVITLVGVAFIAGSYKQKALDQDRRMDGHEARFDRHDVKFDELGSRLGDAEIEVNGLKQWRDGYNAATAATKH